MGTRPGAREARHACGKGAVDGSFGRFIAVEAVVPLSPFSAAALGGDLANLLDGAWAKL